MSGGAGADDDLAARLSFIAGSLNRRLRPPADALTHVALSALASVERAGAVRPGDLARIERIAAPAMTRLVADLEQRGLVTRAPDPEDGRSQLIGVSAAGHRALGAARAERAAGMQAILGDLTPDDRAALERAVAVLERAMLADTAARTA